MSAIQAPMRRRDALRQSEMVKAAGLAAAMVVSNGIALLLTIVFARLLGAADYGSLAALTSTFLILSVPGAAMQVASARETAYGRLGTGAQLAATMARWTRRLLVATVALVVLGLLLREQLAALIGVDESLAAAMTLATGSVWLLMSIQRGTLTGIHDYRPVGISIVLEATGRLLLGLALILVGFGVTGAYLGYPLAMLVTVGMLWWELRRRLGPPDPSAVEHPLRQLFKDAWAPVIGLTLIGVLQNVDVILAKHNMSADDAGAYAAAAVAAKVIIWVAIGIGLHMIPDAARRNSLGEDARPALLRALGLVCLLALPGLAIFAFAPEQLLRLGFGGDLTGASGILFMLGGAMALLAIAYLSVQYLLALHRFGFLLALAVVAVVEPLVLAFGTFGMTGFATVVLTVQLAAVVVVGAMLVVTRAGAHPRPT